MVAFLVALAFIILMLICGIIVNMYLYTHGMFRSSHMQSPRWDEDYFSSSVSGRYDMTGNYVRRGLLFIVIAILLACFVMITFFFPSLH